MAQNAVRSIAGEQEIRPQRPDLRAVSAPKANGGPESGEVVAEILSDGSVRPVANQNGPASPQGWSEGAISGRSWILWWTRRSFSQA